MILGIFFEHTLHTLQYIYCTTANYTNNYYGSKNRITLFYKNNAITHRIYCNILS